MKAVILGGALLAVAVTAGCSSQGEEPKALPALTAVPTPSPAQSAMSAVPPSAQAATPQAAAEFARFWFETLNKAARSGDATDLRAISASGCDTCAAFADSIEKLYSAGGRIEGGVFTIVAAEAPALPPGAGTARVTVIYDVSPSKQLDAGGQELRSTPALRGVDGDMELTRVSGEWRTSKLVTS